MTSVSTTAKPEPAREIRPAKRDDERVCRWCRYLFASVPELLDHVVDVHLIGR